MKIVVLDGFAENPGDLSWDALGSLGKLTVYDRTPAEQIVQRIGGAEIVYTNKTPITRRILEDCSSVRFVGVLSTGYDVVDTAAARERGIPVANIPAYGTAAVAQFTLALLLEVCHHVGHHAEAVRGGRWSASQDFCFWDMPLIELAGKTLGLIGLGRIGKAVARIAAALGMEVIAFDAGSVDDEGKALARLVTLEELYAGSDVVSLHCPLTPESRSMIGEAALGTMRPNAILINTARGPLIDEAAVARALNEGRIAAYACDVVSAEPIRPDNPLLAAKNCIITPHIAWASRESRQRLMDIAVANLKAYLDGRPIHIVNP